MNIYLFPVARITCYAQANCKGRALGIVTVYYVYTIGSINRTPYNRTNSKGQEIVNVHKSPTVFCKLRGCAKGDTYVN